MHANAVGGFEIMLFDLAYQFAFSQLVASARDVYVPNLVINMPSWGCLIHVLRLGQSVRDSSTIYHL